MRSLAILVAAAASAALAAPALAGEIHVPGDYHRLQDALDAAAPGDTVFVSGRHRGNFYALADGITVVGDGATLVPRRRGHREATQFFGNDRRSPEALVLSGDDVAVRGLELRGGGIRMMGDRARVEGNAVSRIRGNDAIAVYGAEGVVADNAVDRHVEGRAVYVAGDAATVRGNRIERVAVGGAIVVEGDGAVVEGSIIDRIAAADGIRVRGAAFRIAGNTLLEVGKPFRTRVPSVAMNFDSLGGRLPSRWRLCPGIAVEDRRGSPTRGVIEGNDVDHVASNGIHVDALDVTITGNRVEFRGRTDGGQTPWVDGDGIAVFGQDCTVTGNTCLSDGILVEGSGHVVAGNVVTDGATWYFRGAGTREDPATVDHGGIVSIGGGNVRIEGNVVTGGSTGIVAGGAWTLVEGNTVAGAGGDGYYVDGDGCVVDACRADGSGGAGLRNAGDATEVVGSTFVGSGEFDVTPASDGTFAVFEGNTWHTGGPGPFVPPPLPNR